MRFNLLLLAAILLGACSKKGNEKAGNENAVITFNDFEALDGWIEIPASVTRERAHSGKYSVKVDPAIEYSLGFQKVLGQVTNKRPKHFKLSAQVYVPSKATGNAMLVFSITDPAKNSEVIVYKEIKLEKVSAFREWVAVEEVIELPENAGFGNILKVYMWRAGASDPVYMDDLKLTATY